MSLRVVFASVLSACLVPAQAVLFQNTADPTFNTTAPAGGYVDSGWQFQGLFGQVQGTVISPHHFITAAHADTGIIPSFNFQGTSYDILTRHPIAGTDLLVVEVNATFSHWAPLYTGSAPLGSELVVTGRGGPRGSAITDSGSAVIGWHTGPSDSTLRWGTNTVDAVEPINDDALYLVLDFDAGTGVSATEAGLSVFDSGGGAFLLEDGMWKLAGITFAMENLATNATGSTLPNAAIFNPDGLYRYSYGTNSWLEQSATDSGTRYFLSDISTSAGGIQQITGVPEPSSSVLALLAMVAALHHRRTSAGKPALP